jgi:hypothetical protein
MEVEVFGELGLAQTWKEYDMLKRYDTVRSIQRLRHEFNGIRKRRFCHEEDPFDVYDFDVMGSMLARLEGGVYEPLPITAVLPLSATTAPSTPTTTITPSSQTDDVISLITRFSQDDVISLITRLSQQVATLEQEIRTIKTV